MTNAVIKSVLLLTDDGSGQTPQVLLARGHQQSNDPIYYQGEMTYAGVDIDTLDADFACDAEPGSTIVVDIVLSNSDNVYTGYATPTVDGNPEDPNGFTCVRQSYEGNSLTLTFLPPKPGQTTGYTKMFFHTSWGIIDPDEETEREPN
ncbi:hypothetical protein NBRC116583_24940 [Arenicella sp. 4NH20-0111]|uniref:hypothetical protein n=1 Tax=Arenicella sp. 4NH20-0111 TaxID=3127648 RepID=UPI0031036594